MKKHVGVIAAIAAGLFGAVAHAATVSVDISGVTTVAENSSGGPDQFGNTVINFNAAIDLDASVIFSAPGVKVFAPFAGHTTQLGAYGAAGQTGTIAYLEDAGIANGVSVDIVTFLFTNVVADSDAPITDNITSTSGLVNGLPLGQIVMSFFIDPSAGLSAASFELSDLATLQGNSSLTVLAAIFDADVDATGQAPAGGPRLVLTAVNPGISFSADPVPLPAAAWLFIAGFAALYGKAGRRTA